MARYVNLDNLNDITIRLIRFFSSVSFEDDNEKEQLAEIIHDLAAIQVRDDLMSIQTTDVQKVVASAWIPVSEQLPEKYGWYLCTLKDDRVNELYYSNGIWLDNAKKHLFDLYDIRSRFTGEIVEPEQESVYWTDWVTAWMPKPEPYRGNK